MLRKDSLRMSLVIDKKTYQKFKAICIDEAISMSQKTRDLIKSYIKRKEAKK